jgi:nucleotide-binding universal stress UspA family protein
MNAVQNEIIVGIREGGSPAAVRFAVEEARRSGRAVHLVHVLQLPEGDAYAYLYGGAMESAKSLLETTEDLAKALAGDDVLVTSELVDSGWTVEKLTDRAGDNQVLVLEHRDLGRLHRVFSGSVAQSIAGRAHVPVVSVPEGWVPRSEGDPVVTAAVQDPTEAAAILRTAFQEARDRDATLVVLHAWWLASGFDATVVDDQMRAEWSERTRTELEPVLAPLRSAFPDVEVLVSVRHAPPIEAVLDAAQVSDLVVLGRRHHLLPLGSHLGPVARAALGHATSPVLVTPESGVTAKEARRQRRAGDLIDDLAPLY